MTKRCGWLEKAGRVPVDTNFRMDSSSVYFKWAYSQDTKKAVSVRFHRPRDTFPSSSVLPSEVVYCLIQVLLVVLAFLLIEHCDLIQKINEGNIIIIISQQRPVLWFI